MLCTVVKDYDFVHDVNIHYSDNYSSITLCVKTWVCIYWACLCIGYHLNPHPPPPPLTQQWQGSESWDVWYALGLSQQDLYILWSISYRAYTLTSIYMLCKYKCIYMQMYVPRHWIVTCTRLSPHPWVNTRMKACMQSPMTWLLVRPGTSNKGSCTLFTCTSNIYSGFKPISTQFVHIKTSNLELENENCGQIQYLHSSFRHERLKESLRLKLASHFQDTILIINIAIHLLGYVVCTY